MLGQENCKVFILGVSQEKALTKFDEIQGKSILNAFWTLFTFFSLNKNLPGKPTFVTFFLFLDFYCYVKFQKKPNEDIPKKAGCRRKYIHTYCGTDTDKWTEKHAFIGPSVSGIQIWLSYGKTYLTFLYLHQNESSLWYYQTYFLKRNQFFYLAFSFQGEKNLNLKRKEITFYSIAKGHTGKIAFILSNCILPYFFKKMLLDWKWLKRTLSELLLLNWQSCIGELSFWDAA